MPRKTTRRWRGKMINFLGCIFRPPFDRRAMPYAGSRKMRDDASRGRIVDILV